MLFSGVIIAVILTAMFPGKPRVVPQKPPVQVKRAAPSSQLTSPRLSGLWKNSDGDLMELMENGDELKIQLIESDRIVRGHGVLTIKGDRLAGDLTAEFVGAGQSVKGDFQGRIVGPDLIEYTVPDESVIRRRSASMWRVADATRSGIVGKVVGITDGDTITVLTADATQVKVRLRGIDTPERSQPFGTKAKELLSRLVGEKFVRIVTYGEDNRQRAIGDVFVRLENSAPRNPDAHVNLIMYKMVWHGITCSTRRTTISLLQLNSRPGFGSLVCGPIRTQYHLGIGVILDLENSCSNSL